MKTIQKQMQVILREVTNNAAPIKNTIAFDNGKYYISPELSDSSTEKYFYLYVLSSEKIETDDYRLENGHIYYTPNIQTANWSNEVNCSKIIASSNPEFQDVLPLISHKFIQEWLENDRPEFINVEFQELYNDGGTEPESWDEVLVIEHNQITCSLVEIRDDYTEMRRLGLTHDQCLEVCDYINTHYKNGN